MSKWSKRSQEDKERILREQQNPKKTAVINNIHQIKGACEKAKREAGNAEKHCSACDLRCPGCPFESVWPKERVLAIIEAVKEKSK